MPWLDDSSPPRRDDIDTWTLMSRMSRGGWWHLMPGHPLHLLRAGAGHHRHPRGPATRLVEDEKLAILPRHWPRVSHDLLCRVSAWKPPSLCHRLINHLERCFLEKGILCTHQLGRTVLCWLAMIYKWESICYNWVSSCLTSLIFCCSSSVSPHPSLASARLAEAKAGGKKHFLLCATIE